MDVCYPSGTDWTCAFTAEELIELQAVPETLAVLERSEALAWSTLASLTGYRLSLCPVVLRPCSLRCGTQTWDQAPEIGGSWNGIPSSGVFAPYMSGGSWFNGCGCLNFDTCSCTIVREILLPFAVGGIAEVFLSGAILDPTAYRIDNANRLVRMDGGMWPICQDMNLPADDDDAFTIKVYPGVGPNDLLRYAAGVLAFEFYKACTGGACRLPTAATTVTRNGITMDIPSGLFPNGGTGIREVDAVIRIYNPHGLRSPGRVMSPDMRQGRMQTWGA